ncbi:hypothetical protein ACIRG5_47720 [Lentzea sp. NPDC102401]|uniref:hypothetical protein n=1 Tax=Lentzea sp. NPDC102401 TaxID=3364128 RepID=UPI0037F37A2C
MPGNRYSLYDTYLAHIRRDKLDRFDREKLLEHLARVRLESELSLLAAARAQVGDGVWPEELTDYLLSVGPFILRGEDLEFIHQSFAEHLAATSRARELPSEFCPTVFAELLHAADARESGRFARAVLLHHTRLHPAEADRLLEWLHRGDAAQHLLATRLLAHHLPASAEVVGAFLTTVQGWALTTQYNAAEILSEASRATSHPGLVPWLTGLMNNDDAPWRSRAECATALAVRVRGQHSPDAVRFLHQVIDEAQVTVADRLVAAEALSQCGTRERDTSERGLREVLADPNAGALSLRTAAVILAAFDGEARQFAIDTLLQILSDVDSSLVDITEAATGLLEIDPEFADISARHFLFVLNTSAKGVYCWDDAATGLASISPAYRDEAIAMLAARITDRRLPAGEQVLAAGALGELGSLHRDTAGELIATMAASAVHTLDHSILLGYLVTCGAQRKKALADLRTLLAEWHLNWYQVGLAASALGSAGPAYREEAAAALVNASAPHGSFDHLNVLSELLNLGEPHRARATRDLHELLADPGVDLYARCRAANILIRSGPDHHPQVIKVLREIASAHPDPVAAPKAYNDLARTGVGGEALAALLDCARSSETAGNAIGLLAVTVAGHGDVWTGEAAEVLRTAVRDERSPLQVRITAARGLCALGSRFDRESAVELRRIITGSLMLSDFAFAVGQHTDKGAGPRRELAEALMAVLADERTTSSRARKAVEALQDLGFGGDEDVLTVAKRLADFPGLPLGDRAELLVFLARSSPHHRVRAVETLVGQPTSVPLDRLKTLTDHLRMSDVDLGEHFRGQLIAGSLLQNERVAVAATLRDASELWRLGRDDLLAFSIREWALRNLVLVEPHTLGEASRYWKAMIDDADAPLYDRSQAVWALFLKDRRTTSASIATLWHFLEAPGNSADERGGVLHFLELLMRPSSPRLKRALVEVLRGPDVAKSAWRQLISKTDRQSRTQLERGLLTNRSIAIDDRVPVADQWDDLPLREEVLAEVRDVMAAPEASQHERARAAVALFGVSFVFQAEAVAALEGLSGRSSRSALAGMSQAHWWLIHDEALAQVVDESLPYRVRHAAACLLKDINAEPTDAVKKVWYGAPSWLQRINGLLNCKDVDAVRGIRDDVDGLPVSRVQAAWRLRLYRSEDRAAGIQVIDQVAEDDSARPRFRVRAVSHLVNFGTAGRKRAALVARAMMSDIDLPVLARAEAAALLCKSARTSRREVLGVLTELVPQADPLRRVEVLKHIGALDSARAMVQLHALAASQVGPVVRMRCARALVAMRHDQRERASVIARSVAWDESVPPHVRRNAARDLARWSELMRQDARDLFVQLSGKCAE